MFSFKKKTYLRLILYICLISIISAYFIEYVLGYQPCNLCLIERIPYGLGVILLVVTFFSNKNEKFIVLLLILIFSFSSIISIYHFGIEQGFFQESSVCGLKNSAEILSKKELLKQLQEKMISCKDVTFKIFGFSLTSINIIISLFITILLIKIFISYEKKKY
tara:strand:+ start:82 stop:570 length:489 start_codon:yes stop_codon:yes gene_type:complete